MGKTPVRPYPKCADFVGETYFANVVYVEVAGKDLKEIEPLAALKHLKYLSISGTQVSDPTPLVTLVSYT